MSDLDDNADRMSSDESSREDESESIIALLFKESSPDAVASNAESKPTAIDITDIFHGDVLTIWLQKRTEAVNQGEDYSLSNNAESRRLLLTVINYVNNQEFTIESQNAQRALSELLTVAKEVLIGSLEQIKFPEYFMCLRKLADYGDGHLSLVKAVTDLVGYCSRPYLCQKDVAEKLQSNISGGRHAVMMESTCHMLTYIEEVFSAIGKQEDAVVSERPASPLDVGAGAVGGHEDFEWMDDASGKEEDDSNGEDSDEDSLSNKQCTFTFTHKEFMNQHWYHCHTCNMVDGVGVCTVCAKICHAGHDVTYAKYGSFFCDCGAKEDGACRALMRRSSADKISSRHPQSILSHRSTETKARSSSFRKHGSSDEEHSASSDHDHKLRLWSVDGGQPIKLSEQQKAEVAGLFDSSKFSEILIQTLEYLKPSIVSSINESVLIGSSLRAGRALTDLHTIPKRVQSNDNLLLPTLGSQEGAFENVKLSYTGDQGPLIRQLIGSNVIRRVAMCLLNSVNGKRQHLAVSHEKGKITLLQLSVLLKQADSSKRKLTLTRLASAPVPFTVLSIVANPCNEDYLAVLGLKDCHILTFSSNGTILSHVVVQLHLDTGNYVIKGLWLPGSHTEFAVVTSDFVKIYDLSVDAEKPTYHFLPSSGKIRDVTFVFSEKSNQRHILIMTSTGHIISQEMCGESSATNGPFYVTNILEVLNTDMTGTNVNGGGVSIYYSHLLQLLFMSYTNGRSFMAPLSEMGTSLPTLFPIDANGSSASTSPKSKNSSQPLCSWSEIANHPGLILASNQLTNNPVILMVTPTSVQVQEIKFQSVKFADMVALRHSTSTGDLRTTLILLCEDGSLRIYMASNEATSYWLKIQTNAFMSQLKGTTKLSVDKKPAGDHGVASEASAALTTNFPVDFFEHCHVMTEQIEFGGNDVLQVYNVQQIKTRLNTSGQYIASTKPHFAIDVVNNDPTMVMVGVRVLVGTQDVSRAPSYFELFGRSVQIGNILQSRWFDLPLAREESLQADKRFSLVFGASSDANGIIMVDSIKVYGKSKEAFGWPDEDVEYSTATSSSAGANETLTDISAVEKLLATTFSVLQGTISKNAVDATLKSRALTLVADMFTLPFSQLVTLSMKSLMVSLYSSRQLFYTERDHLVLEYVVKTLIDCEHLDGDTLLRLVLLCRTICSSRPSNFSMLKAIVKTCLSEIQAGPANPSSSYQKTLSDSLFTMAPFELFVKLLFDAFWRLYSLRPKNGHLASISASGLIEPDIVVSTSVAIYFPSLIQSLKVESLVDIVHALTLADLSNISFACKYYLKLLLCDDTSISFAAKVELIRVLKPRSKKRKVAQSETSEFSFEPKFGGKASQASSMPGPASRTQNVNSAMTSNAYVPHQAVDFFSGADFAADLNEATFSYSSVAHNIQAVEEMLEMGASFADLNMADLQGDADDDAMAELAMALSLQDQNLAEPSSPSMLVEAVGHVSGAVSAVASHAASGLQDDRGQFSDTTASAAASDDEGSTAATEGSTLRTSPTIEQAPRLNESELASPSESVIGESGHSSAYGEEIASQPRTPFRGRMESLPETDTESSETWNRKLHSLRIVLLEKLIECLPSLREVGGVRCIPVMQVMLMLSSDLESEDEVDMSKLSLLLDRLLRELQFGSSGKEEMTERTRNHEVQLIIMRFLSIMMSRIKSSSPSGSSSKDGGSMSLLPVPLISSVILSSNLLELCLHMLVSLLDYWRLHPMDENTTEASRNVSALLKLHSNTSPPDMSPFFLKQYVKSHAEDVFELYPQLLTEMVLRLPYQMKKMSNALESMSLNPADLKYGGKQVASLKFSGVWLDYLCEYMMTPLTPYVKKQVRKLLSYICNSKEMYRQIRDNHALGFHLKKIKSLCKQGGFSEHQSVVGLNYTLSLDYDATITLVENLKACNEIASNRMHNWQRFCLNDTNVLPFLVRISLLAEEGVSSTILQLLLAAVSPSKNSSKSETLRLASEPSMNDKLSSFLLSHLDSNLLSTFIKCFLLEFKSTSLRWQAHSLVYNLYKNFELSSEEQLVIIETLWSLWPLMPSYGKKAAQFVDILGYFTLCAGKQNVIGKGKERMYAEYALNVLKSQNALLQNHPNSTMYNSLQSLVEFDGYYLESEPCLVCNNPEISFANIKLSSLKVDSRFTTTTQIVKLVGSHAISKISIRISDIKRSKMVKTLSIYYNNRTVHSVVELKNKTNIWHKAKKCPLTTGQSEVKMEFPLPIVACNLMIEYSEFYENILANSETLQCPRCSASVPATPGVCAQCGENVYQCHKCRAINYDEKDPFLCNSCGFCKYAKFDYTLTAKPTCAVDAIENEDDRKKTVQSLNTMLEKADRTYKNLLMLKPTLEVLLMRSQDHAYGMEKLPEETNSVYVAQSSQQVLSAAGGALPSVYVNRAIQQIAHKYCYECKGAFDELSKMMQKILASRKELVDYDNRQREKYSSSVSSQRRASVRVLSSPSSVSGRCYGCASATVEHCITLLKAMATLPKFRQVFCANGLLRELLDYSLHNNSSMLRSEARQLLCNISKDSLAATLELNNMIIDQISAALDTRSGRGRLDLGSSVRHCIALLICSLDPEDSCWEQRLRCLMQVFMMGISADSAIIQEAITLPCLRIIIKLVKPDSPTSKRNKDKSVDALATVCPSGSGVVAVDLNKWMTGEVDHSFRAWKQRTSKKPSSLITFQGGNNRLDARSSYLSEKYGHRWYNKTLRKLGRQLALELSDTNWLKALLFNRFSRTIRVLACSLVEALYAIPSRSKEMIDMLTSCLCDLGSTGEFGFEFFATFHSLVQKGDWRYYLALKGTLLRIGCLISNEIEILNELEETTLNSSLSEGSALKMLVDILTVFVEVPAISKKFKSRLITFVLDGYLSLRKLVVQRTKLIDETQDALLELLEEMTTGTETEMSSFMEVCLDAVAKCNLDDLRTPVFIFERLCSIIFPEENDSSEFFITLEKDPQQEDFLQGRMLGNPYPSNEPGLGPLMRDIKNKICQDCELVALLDDDSGMELLICNKIISLDLTVKQVYRKVWCVENSESEAMRVVYRMRGLMGDATEEFIESLDSKENKQVDDEHVYRMATVMSKRNGLEILFQRLDVVSDLSPRCRPLLLVLLKLLGHCTKVKSNRQRLIDAPLKAVDTLLKITKMALVASPSDIAPATGSGTSAGQPNVLEQLLSIMEIILREASYLNGAQFDLFSRTCGTSADITFLLTQSSLASSNAKSNTLVKQLLMRLLAFLALGSWEKMDALLAFFSLRLQFKRFDFEHTADDEQFFDSFAMLANAIEVNENGNRLKDVILKESNIVTDAIEYLTIHAPQAKTALLAASDEWKEFTQRPALRFVLKILTGLCTGHLSTQLALVSAGTIPVVHGLEQVSSDSHAGSLAEELLETLKENETVAATIAMVRRQTKEEKKRLAMAVREKQLGELGLRTNIYGQVTATSEVLKQVGDLDEESGLVCNICREGYQFQPTKVLGLYTFTKRCPVEAVEGHSPSAKSTRKTMGYSTVTHFNVVHVDCHMAAVRHARGRDEWESAALQNASTRCNGLLPLWGPQVAESAFASALARHNTYLQEATGHRDVNPQSSVHDLKLLLVKFATEESFSVDSGGGGPQSNIHLIPYLAHHVLYVLNTTRAAVREVKKCASFLETPANKWPEAAFDAESVHYWATMYLLLNSAESWNKDRLTFLKRFLYQAHVRRNVSSSQATQLSSSAHEYSAYKPSLVFFGLINLCYTTLFKGAQKSDMGDWSLSLAEFIRHKDQQLYENGEKMLETYQSDLLTCESFAEFCDVTSLSSTCITNPDEFLSSLF